MAREIKWSVPVEVEPDLFTEAGFERLKRDIQEMLDVEARNPAEQRQQDLLHDSFQLIEGLRWQLRRTLIERALPPGPVGHTGQGK